MLRIGICDDDIHMLTYLSKLCQKIMPEARVDTYHNGCGILDIWEEFQIILMDIKMDGSDGLEIIRQLRGHAASQTSRSPAVIFITAYDQYVFHALDLFAFHYLLKPLDEAKFEHVLKTAAAEYASNTDEEALSFHTKSCHFRIYPSQILYVESDLRKAVIHTEKDTIEIYITMAELEKLLGRQFYRCHRGFLVNLGKIQKYDRKNIILVDGSSVFLSQAKYSGFVEAFLDYIKR